MLLTSVGRLFNNDITRRVLCCCVTTSASLKISEHFKSKQLLIIFKTLLRVDFDVMQTALT